jgi:hypothetical protein
VRYAWIETRSAICRMPRMCDLLAMARIGRHTTPVRTMARRGSRSSVGRACFLAPTQGLWPLWEAVHTSGYRPSYRRPGAHQVDRPLEIPDPLVSPAATKNLRRNERVPARPICGAQCTVLARECAMNTILQHLDHNNRERLHSSWKINCPVDRWYQKC